MVREPRPRLFSNARSRKPFPFSCADRRRRSACRAVWAAVSTVRLGVMHRLERTGRAPAPAAGNFSKSARSLKVIPTMPRPRTYGGFNVARDGHGKRSRVSAALHFVLLVPEFRDCDRARAPRSAVPNRSHCTRWKTAGTHAPSPPRLLRAITKTCAAPSSISLHQPFRKKLIPFLDA